MSIEQFITKMSICMKNFDFPINFLKRGLGHGLRQVATLIDRETINVLTKVLC